MKTHDPRLRAAAFDGAPEAMLVASGEGVLLDANSAARRAFGREALERPEARIADLLAQGETFDVEDWAGSRGPAVVRTVRFLDRVGRPFEASIAIAAVLHADLELMVLQLRSVPPDTSAQAALLALNEDLLSLHEDLAERVAHLEGFASVAAHDLQDPLRKIAILSDMLIASHGPQMDEQGRTRLEAIRSTSRRMRTLVDGLLLYARSSGRRLRIEDAPLSALVDDAREALEAMIAANEAQFEIAPLPAARIDPELFVHVLQNIFSNAMKYRREEAPRISVSAETDEDAVILRIDDNGKGFDMARHDYIFRAFTRLHRRDEVAGDGIGLALCKRIVERHGGRIWAESEIGRGSCFFVRLPRGRERARQRVTTPSPAPRV